MHSKKEKIKKKKKKLTIREILQAQVLVHSVISCHYYLMLSGPNVVH